MADVTNTTSETATPEKQIPAHVNPGNTARAAGHLNERFDGVATAVVEGDELVVTIGGLAIDPSVRRATLANPNFANRIEEVKAAIGETGLVNGNQYTLLTPRQQIASESLGKLHRVENAILEDLLTVRHRKNLIDVAVHDDPAQTGKAVATLRVKAELLRDMDTLEEHLRRKTAINAATGAAGKSA